MNSEDTLDMTDVSLDRLELLGYLLGEDESPSAKPEFGHTQSSGPVPLTSGQQRLWFLDQLNPGNPFYNIGTAVRLEGALGLSALEQSLNSIVNRHESLRTTFPAVDGEPIQEISRPVAESLPVVDLTALSASGRDSLASLLLQKDMRYAFGLKHGPLWMVTLLRIQPDEHICTFSLHHIIGDAWSVGIFVEELTSLYGAYRRGAEPTLRTPSFQYRDYAFWQQEWLRCTEYDLEIAFWKQALAGLEDAAQIQPDKPRPAIQRYVGGRESCEIDSDDAQLLARFTERHGATLFTTLLALFKALIYRYGRSDDVVVGSPMANRSLPETEEIIGFFVSTAVLRTKVKGKGTFLDLLRAVRSVAIGAQEHPNVPFERIVEELDVKRDLSHSPLFQVMFALQKASNEALVLEGLQLTTIPVANGTSKFDLTLDMWESGGRVGAVVDYSRDLYDRTTIQRMIGHFKCLISCALKSPDTTISQLQLCSGAERQQLLTEWNDTRRDFGKWKSVVRSIDEQRDVRPDGIAVIFEDLHLSYWNLIESADILASWLAAASDGAERVVAVRMERSAELVVTLVGVLRAGAAYMPLDPDQPEERAALMVKDARAYAVLERGTWKIVATDGTAALLPDQPYQGMFAETRNTVSEENTAYVIYTSGSTGKPKGVAIPHEGFANRLMWMQEQYQLTETDRIAQKTPYSFDVSVWEFFWPLMVGAQVVLARPGAHRDPGYLAGFIAQQGITVIHFVPSMLQPFLQQARIEELSSLRLVVCSGEALSVELKDWFCSRSQARLANLYGPTEASIDVTSWLCSDDHETTIPIGRPIANTQVLVLTEDMEPAPIGVAGEVFIGGVGLARGYIGRPDVTAQRFVPDCLAGIGARLYRTGDLGRNRLDGAACYLGRLDHQVKVRGYRIELGEIEAAIAKHGDVEENVVILSKEESARLLAYVVYRQARKVSPEQMRRFLKQLLPEYMIPAVFVTMEALPLTPHGKLDRSRLPGPDGRRLLTESVYVAPRSEVEEALAAIWEAVLGLDKVGIDDNFFALGGDSIRSVKVLALAQERGLRFTLQGMFQHQTIRELAIEAAVGSRDDRQLLGRAFEMVSPDDRAGIPDDIVDAYPLTMLQAGMLYHMEQEPDLPVYHNINSYLLRGEFSTEAFEQAVLEVVNRHEIFRTSFDLAGYSEPLQLVHARSPLPLTIEDLSSLYEPEQDEAVRDYIRSEKTRSFDFNSSPLCRFKIHLLGDSKFQYTVTECHAILDGWSLQSTHSEIFERYFAILHGTAVPVVSPGVRFRDFVAMERAALASEECKAYWEELLDQYCVAGLPRWRALDAPGSESRIGRVTIRIEEEGLSRLQRAARLAAVPLKSVLLAGHLKVMSLITGTDDVLTGLVSNGRPETMGGDDVRGLFLNTLPFRFKLPDGSWVELLRAVFRREIAVLPYRRYPLAAIQSRFGSRSIIDSAFTYLNFHVLNGVLRSGDVEVLAIGEGQELTNIPVNIGFMTSLLEPVMEVSIAYDTAEICEEQANQIAGLFRRVFAALGDEPNRSHQDEVLLSDSDLRLMLYEWNDTRKEYAPFRCVHELFEVQSAKGPESVGVIHQGRHLTYKQLNDTANQWAHCLRELGVGPDVLVAICMERRPELIVAILAVLKAGGAYVPLDHTNPPDRVSDIIHDAGIGIMLTGRSLDAHREVKIRHLLFMDDGPPLGLDGPDVGEVPGLAAPENLAYAIFTSGSTGKPKGVMITHRGLANYLLWAIDYYKSWSALGAPVHSSIGFDLTVTSIFAPLIAGAPVSLVSERSSIDGLASEFSRAGNFGLVKITPAHLDLLKELVSEQHARDATAVFVIGGDALLAETITFWQRAAPSTRLINEYGPTETVVGCCIYEVPAGQSDTGPVPIGFPIANTTLRVLNMRGFLVPVGTPAELHIGGHGVARGYLGMPGLTAEKFIPDAFGQTGGERLYKSGDLARYLPNGVLEYLSRVDEQVKVNGYRIEPGEIGAVLAAHDDVRDAVVTAEETRGGGKQLVAYLVADGADIDLDGVRRHLASRLPQYMLPSSYFRVNEIPLNVNGKVDRALLPELIAAKLEKRLAVAPRTGTESIIADIWTEVIGSKALGIYDQFLEVGGNSLSATQVVSRVRRVFGEELTLGQFFDAGTIAELGRLVDMGGVAGGRRRLSDVKPAPPGSVIPLSYAQQRLWFLDRLEPLNAAYNVPGPLRVRGGLAALVLEQAVGEIIRRHHILRTYYRYRHSTLEQRIDDDFVLSLPVVDLGALSHQQRELQKTRLAVEEAVRPFVLDHCPLHRLSLLRLAAHDHALLLTMHHSICDAWSREIFGTEVAALYTRFLSGNPSQLPGLKIQYGDFAVWQRSSVDAEILDLELGYWKQQFESTPAAIDLPGDRPRPNVQTYNGASHPVNLRPDQMELFETIRRREGVTLFMAALAAFYALLRRYSGQDTVVVGTPVAGRVHLETEQLIGLFANTLAIPLQFGGGLSYRQLLARVRKATLGAYAHQNLPFDRLVEELRPTRNTSINPLFQVMFALVENKTAAEEIPALKLETISLFEPAAKFDLTLTLVPNAEGLSGSLEYNRDIFDAGTVLRMIGDFAALAENLCSRPDDPLSSISLLTPVERLQAVARRNDAHDVPIASAPDYLAPRTHIERLIESVWRELLQTDQLGLEDNFFDLGGHSFLLIEVQRQLQEKMRTEIPLIAMFQHPTIRSLGRFISNETAESKPSYVEGRNRAKKRAASRNQEKRRGSRAVGIGSNDKK